MTSIQFQIDPAAMRILHGPSADHYERRRERERNTVQARHHRQEISTYSENGRLVEALALVDRNPANRPAISSVPSNANGPNAAARFFAAGGRPLNLDRMDYEQVYNMFSSNAPRGTGSDVIEACSNVFKLDPDK
jgi:hypothetical protein